VTSQTILGIDPGAHGAVAMLDESGELLEVLDRPSTPEANGRTATSAPMLAPRSLPCPRRLLRVHRSPPNRREGCGLSMGTHERAGISSRL
jgi:hypothetical protein